jgi:signal transduction histidine kinase/HPt (histidine-containing phosphotransfer) domain-containing protein
MTGNIDKFNVDVLYVEDDVPSRVYVSTILKARVNNLYIADNGKIGLELFEAKRPDIVITDIGMPVMNGLELARRIKDIDPNVPIILTTAFDLKHYLLESIEIGISDYILKPVQKKQFLEALQRVTHFIFLQRQVEDQQEQLKAAHSDLEKRVNERTAELEESNTKLRNEIEIRKFTEEKLINAKEEAVAANKAKDAFLAKVSHELRTPLNGIIGLSSLMKSTELTERQIKYTDMVKLSADNLLKIINEILDFSKIEAGKLSLRNLEFKLRPLIEQSIFLIEQSAKQKNIDLSFQLSKRVPKVIIGDSGRILQILLNLLGNAVKFTDNGSIRLSVDVEKIENEIIELQFSVVDTGIGIPSDKLDDIFNSFSQAEETFTRKYGGTGLGLSIAREIIHLMEGEISVESELGSGSRFSFNIKLKLPKNFEDISQSYEDDDQHLMNKYEELSNLSILIADDSIINQEVLKQALINKVKSVYTVSSGLEVLDFMKSVDIDIILMDIQMPGMDGIETTKVIRSEESGELLLPIIGLTAHTQESFKITAIEAGMTDFISKPFKWKDIFTKIKKYVPKRVTNMEYEKPDLNSLIESVSGNFKVIGRLIVFYLNNYQEEVDQLIEFFNTEDYESAGKLSHKIKSEVGNFGAYNAIETSGKIEKLIKAGDFENANIQKNKLVDQMNNLADFLKNYLIEINTIAEGS